MRLPLIAASVLVAAAACFAEYLPNSWTVESVEFIEDKDGNGTEGSFVFSFSETGNPLNTLSLYTAVNYATGDQAKKHQIADSYLAILLSAKASGSSVIVKQTDPGLDGPPISYKVAIPGHYPNGIRRILGVKLK